MPVRPFEIVYNATEPYKSDVVIDSAEDGLRLRFDSVRQVLTMIDFYDVNRVALKYGRVVIFGGDISATFMSVYNNDTELPMEFPNGSTPAATGFMVFMGGDYRSVGVPAPTKRHYFEEVEVEIGEEHTSLVFAGRKQRIELGWSPQVPEVVSELGAPVSVFRKSEDPNDGYVAVSLLTLVQFEANTLINYAPTTAFGCFQCYHRWGTRQ
ncbi:hypothetical protein BBJ28_00018150 [Nothophytophthora sp. Chile5]|nr:hypothetical protein BBJ28_00018150 [Nothophytophthora sp. Chile5]